MRVISWNCNMAFRKKAQFLSEYKADILVIQESEHPYKLKINGLEEYTNRIWIGSNRNKGLLVMSKRNFCFNQYPDYSEKYRYILPLRVQGQFSFYLFAVWTQNTKDDWEYRYIGQLWKALHEYEALLAEPSIIIGDFNSNAIWNPEHNKASHNDVANYLGKYDIKSLYHWDTGEEPGRERTNTYSFWKKLDRCFHIDYCFASDCLIQKCSNFNILDIKEWLKFSDHAPLIVDFQKF
jgi:exodeoxyribonuclease III